MRSIRTALFFFLVAATAGMAQTLPNRPADASGLQLTGVCGGAWNDVQHVVNSLRHFDAVTSKEEKAKIDCLLAAANDQKFAPRDEQLDQVLAAQMIRILVNAYGPANYDLFAQLLPRQPERVKEALTSALLEHGQPEAFDAYFSRRRAALANHRSVAGTQAVARLFRPLIERGTCGASLCSDRLAETLRIVGANLDLVALEVQTASAAARGDSPENQSIRTEAKQLLETIDRIQRGQQTIGSAQ